MIVSCVSWCVLVRVCSCLSLVYIISIYSTVLSDSRSMADTPRKLDRINSILLTDDVLASGPRTPWSPIRGLTGRRPGSIAATRLLDLEDEEFENSSGWRSIAGGVVRQLAPNCGARARGLRIPAMKTAWTMEKLCGQNIVPAATSRVRPVVRGDGVLGISRSRERYLLEPWSTTVVIIVTGREDATIGVKAGPTPLDSEVNQSVGWQ